jgi:hypothetical protein
MTRADISPLELPQCSSLLRRAILGRPGSTQADSEQFRSAPRTYQPLCGRLGVDETERTGPSAALICIGEKVPMLKMKGREFVALVGGGGLLLSAKVSRARAQQPPGSFRTEAAP